MATTPEAVIERPDVDAVILASPDRTHVPYSIACIRHGKKVLCEKPLSHTAAECLPVMQTEQSAGAKFVQLGYMRRYDRAYLEMKQALADGALGRPLMMHNFHRNVNTPTAEFTGAMAITNSAPHEFDIVRHVLGVEFVKVTAHQAVRSDDLVAPVVMVLETSEGQLVIVEVNNNAAYGYDVRAELIGEKGSISIRNPACTSIDAELVSSTRYNPDWGGLYAEAYRRQNLDFVRFVESGQFPENGSDCWDGYCVAVVAEAGVKALSAGSKVSVEMIDRPEFYA